MKQGRSLQQLATELQRQNASKRDFYADTRRLRYTTRDSGSIILEGVGGGMELNPRAHQQMAASLDIPRAYYDRMLIDAPDLLARNCNHWLETKPEDKMIRTMDGKVRAVLSSSYRPLDNLDLLTASLPKLMQLECRVESCEVTEDRLYLKAVTERVSGEVTKGDIVQAGIMITNSEIGLGSLGLAHLHFQLICLNGLVRDDVVRKVHVGRRANVEVIDNAREYYRDATRAAEDKAFFMKVRDSMSLVFDPKKFNRSLDEYRVAAGMEIEADPVAVVEEVTKRMTFSDEEGRAILKHLVAGKALTKWGLVAAITRAAQDVPDYGRSVELEEAGGKVLELSKNDWQSLAV